MQYLWKHKKTGHLYRIMGFALIEKGLVPAVIYARDGELTQFIRPCDEFFDGRFRQVDAVWEKDDDEEDGPKVLNQDLLAGARKRMVVNNAPVGGAQVGGADGRFGGPVPEESIADKEQRAFQKKGEAL